MVFHAPAGDCANATEAIDAIAPVKRHNTVRDSFMGSSLFDRLPKTLLR
jgi:hypothetical protein